MNFPIRHRANASGIMLVECLVYIMVVIVVLGLAFVLFYKAFDHCIGLRRNAEDITSALRAGERWRQDIRDASGALTKVPSDPRPMWRVPQAEADVYYLQEEGSIWRFASSNSVPEEVLSHVRTSEMRNEKRQEVECGAWTVELKPRRKGPRVRPVFHFLAVPTGKEAP